MVHKVKGKVMASEVKGIPGVYSCYYINEVINVYADGRREQTYPTCYFYCKENELENG